MPQLGYATVVKVSTPKLRNLSTAMKSYMLDPLVIKSVTLNKHLGVWFGHVIRITCSVNLLRVESLFINFAVCT